MFESNVETCIDRTSFDFQIKDFSSTDPQPRENAGTLSQWLSESKSTCQILSTRAAGGLTCQLQVDNWELESVPSLSQGAAAAAGRRARLSTRMGLQGRVRANLSTSSWLHVSDILSVSSTGTAAA